MERFDIVIVGGGIIGCAIARELAQTNARVCLLERGRIGAEASGAAAGMLGVQSENEDETLLRFGAESRYMYKDLVIDLEAETGLPIEYSKLGTLYLCFTDADEALLEARRAKHRALGMSSEWLRTDQARARDPAINSRARGVVHFERDGRLSNTAVTAAYAAAAKIAGAAMREGVTVHAVRVERGRVVGVETNGGPIRCDIAINAAGAWAAELAPGLKIPVSPVRGQMVVLQHDRPLFRHAVYSTRGYAVARQDGRVLLGSTREPVGFDKRVTVAGVQTILEAAHEIAPKIGELAVKEMWAGLRPATPDGLPLIGRDPTLDGFYVATGHYRNGILLAPITARIIGAALRGEPPAWALPVRPDRFVAGN